MLGACGPSAGTDVPLPPDAGEAAADAAAPTPAPPLEPGPAAMVRLTRAQYQHVIADVFGPDVVVPGPLEPDVALDGLWAIGAGSSTISPRGVEGYEAAAFAIAEQVAAAPAPGVLPCGLGQPGCVEAALPVLGHRLWRRPLTADEQAAVLAIARDATAELGSPRDGLTFGLAALLQSPWFLFRPTLGATDGPTRPVTDAEYATRLAFFLWDSTPSAGLLAAAEAGDLARPSGRRAWVEALLDDPRAARGVRAFFNDYLKLRELDALTKDPAVFARYSPELGPMAREETLATLAWLVLDVEGDYRAAFTDQTTFLNRKLAALYGVPAPAAEGFARADLPADGPRAGLLGQASFLAQHAHPVSSSATLRGRFIRETLLCGTIPAPPADVDTSLPEPSGDLPTLRDRVAVHMTAPSCAGCHQVMDPIGLGLEQFDGLGRFRETENDTPIDASGALDGVPFADARGLGEAIAAHPKLTACLTRKLYSYALGRAPTVGEAGELVRLEAAFAASGYRVKALLAAIALSDGLRTIAAPGED